MKEPKPLTPDFATQQNQIGDQSTEDNQGLGQRAPGSASVEQVPLRLKPTMHNNEIQARKRHGRLGRDVQSKLGKTLQAYFDDVVKEGVPDRFRDLLQQFDERKEKGSS